MYYKILESSVSFDESAEVLQGYQCVVTAERDKLWGKKRKEPSQPLAVTKENYSQCWCTAKDTQYVPEQVIHTAYMTKNELKQGGKGCFM
jgi:hypothetical protein